jgi:hypothetical protein
MMDRDRRLTGYLRGQTDNVAAPPGFEVNNPWKVRYALCYDIAVLLVIGLTQMRIAGATNVLNHPGYWSRYR